MKCRFVRSIKILLCSIKPLTGRALARSIVSSDFSHIIFKADVSIAIQTANPVSGIGQTCPPVPKSIDFFAWVEDATRTGAQGSPVLSSLVPEHTMMVNNPCTNSETIKRKRTQLVGISTPNIVELWPDESDIVHN